MLLAVVAGITILLAFRQRLFTRTNLRVLVLPALAMDWVVLPWIAISSNLRVYVLYLEHLIAPDTLLSYALALPGQVGWPLLILSISGLIAGLLARRKVVGIVLCRMLLLNFLFVMDVTAPRVIDRFATHFVPGLAILAGIALGALDGRKLVAASVLAALSGIAVLGTWFFDDGRRVSLLSRDGLRYATEPLLPFDQVAEWLDSESRQLPDGERLDFYLPIPCRARLRSTCPGAAASGSGSTKRTGGLSDPTETSTSPSRPAGRQAATTWWCQFIVRATWYCIRSMTSPP